MTARIMTKRTLTDATVTGRRELAHHAWLIELEVELEAPVRAGQFAMVHPLEAGTLLPRPFSVLDHRDGRLKLYVKEVGAGSRALAHTPLGERVQVFAPLGRSFPIEEFRGRPVVLVAGGVGLVPLWKLRSELLASGEEVPHSLFGARTIEELPGELLEGWRIHLEEAPPSAPSGEGSSTMSAGGGLPTAPTGSGLPTAPAGGEVEVGLVTLHLDEILREQPDAVLALCGPDAMMKAAARIGRQRGVQVWVCLEEQMACGAGVCRSCTIPAAGGRTMKTVCQDGPVFSLDEIDYV